MRSTPTPTRARLAHGFKRLIPLAGLILLAHVFQVNAGSGTDTWGIDTLVNLPPGKSRLTVPNQAGDTGVSDPVELPCQCSDANPRDNINQNVGTSCFFQRIFGACNQDFMFDTNAELLPEGSCQISCDRCSCCSAPDKVIAQLGGNRFIQALQAAYPSLTNLFSNPGFVATILVPSDQAFDAAMSKYGSLLQNPAVLQQIIKFHIIPSEPQVNALWTTPFFTSGVVLHTMHDGSDTLTVPSFDLPAGTTWKGGLTGFTIQGPYNSAMVTESDVMACKSYINIIDSVLLPFDPASPPPNNENGASVLLGASSCSITSNSMIKGSMVSTSIQQTVGNCCNTCGSTPNCNAWTFCAQLGGCEMSTGIVVPFGQCDLKTSEEVRGGNLPAYDDVDAAKVPLISGWLSSFPPSISSFSGLGAERGKK